MDPFDFTCDDDLSLYPECKLINYLVWVTNILNCEQTWDVDGLCLQMEQMDLGLEDEVEVQSDENSIILDSMEVREILLADCELVCNLEVCIKVLLKFVRSKLETFDKGDCKQVLSFATTICRFAQACGANKILVVPVKKHLTKFLSDLFSILGTADVHLTTKGPVDQLAVRIIVSFKSIDFARKVILMELSKGLKLIGDLLQTTSISAFDMISYEVLLLYVMVLKQTLEYNFENMFLKLTVSAKAEDKVLKGIGHQLTNMMDKLPEFVAVAVQEGLNLLS